MEDGRRYCVYRHTTPNGKVYIGITCKNPIRRWNGGTGYRGNEHFFNAIMKYGWDNIVHEILYSDLSKQDACEKEIELIRFHQSNNRLYGYNHSTGGEHPSTGVVLTEETRKKMSESQKGKTKSTEHRKKIGESNRKYNILQMTLDGDIVAIYPSTQAAADAVGCTQSLICMTCNGHHKTAKHYKWRYEPIK